MNRTTERPAKRNLLNVMRPGPFRRYMTAETLSSIGTWMQNMAQSWVMTGLTQSAFMLGLVNFASGVPMLLLTMIGGSFADRFDKRRILGLTLSCHTALAVLMAYLVGSGRIQLWHVLAIAVVMGIVNSFEMPAVSALVPELVEKDEISDAIAVDRSTFHATRLVGPALAGLLIGWWGSAAAYVANAVSFLPLLFVLPTLKPRHIEHPDEGGKRSIKEGIAYVRSDRPTMAMIGLLAMTTLFVFPIMLILLPLYARNELGLPASGMGLLMGVAGVGSLTGSLGLLLFPRERRIHGLAVASAAMVAAVFGLAIARSLWLAIPALALVAVCLSTMFGLANTTIQERAPDHLRGRVSAVSSLSFFGLQPLAALGISSLSDGIGMRPAMMASAIAFALGASYMLLGPARAMGRPSEPPAEA
ncbi:MAG TPA: MFS transporter [Stenomitos sp.]